jgi:hypothetical protein
VHLVEQRGAVVEGAQEAVWAGAGEIALQRIVEADAPVALADLVAQKRRLAALVTSTAGRRRGNAGVRWTTSAVGTCCRD